MQSPANTELTSNDFLYAVAHELKTPLNAVIGFLDVLQEEIDNPKSLENCKNYIKEINSAALDLNELISDLLDVSQTSSGNFSIDLSNQIDISDVIKRSIRLNHDHALRKNITIKSINLFDSNSINLDEKRTKQILVNLISNAVKYSLGNSEIKVVTQNILAENNQKYLQISIVDQGFGMSAEEIKNAFQKYKTISTNSSKTLDSFGLGLPITKQLVELQNGVIEIKSEVGKGSEVLVKFPYLMQ
jgi:two-component system cell cycle sensor histidine kinase PleC